MLTERDKALTRSRMCYVRGNTLREIALGLRAEADRLDAEGIKLCGDGAALLGVVDALDGVVPVET